MERRGPPRSVSPSLDHQFSGGFMRPKLEEHSRNVFMLCRTAARGSLAEALDRETPEDSATKRIEATSWPL